MTSFTAITARLNSLQLALAVLTLLALAVVAGSAVGHLSALGLLSDHPVNPICRGC